MKEIYIYGCGGVGSELVALLMNGSDYQVMGFIDDNPDVRECMGYQSWTLNEIVKIKEPSKINTIISIGEPAIREAVSMKIAEKGLNEVTINLSDHSTPQFCTVGDGTLFHVNSYISVNTHIGKCCMINKGALVGHDCVLGNYTVLSPRVTLGGNVTIGDSTYVGTGAIIRNGITIGKNVIIGMGSVVVKNVEDNMVVVGNPAKFMRLNESRRVFVHK